MLVMPLFKTPLYISLFRQRDSQTYSVIPPRSEANIATKVVFRRVPTSLDDEQWGTEPNYVTLVHWFLMTSGQMYQCEL